MRIAIDARLNAYRRGGIPQYTRQLLTALSEITTEEQFISLQHRDMLRPLAVAPNVTRRTVYTPPHHRFERWTLPFEVALARPDVLHFPDFIAPTYRPCPAVVTIHDLAFMHYPQILDDAARAFYQQVLTNTHRADAVIAVSEATRQDIVQFLDVPVDDVKVIYEAAAPLFRRMDLRHGEARVLNGKPVAAGTFMLFVSTLEPRKNVPTLLQALRICLDRSPARPYKLVIVGGRGWNDEPIFTAIRDLRLADHVLLAGSVGQYDLRWLYNACQFYINPSLYEGFGLPLLEAMACGAACLAAATSSLPEIAGDAALYVPPLEPDQWADAMEALWDNRGRQHELGRIGQARAQRFSWARAARETLQIYYHAAEKRSETVATRAPAPTPARRTAQPPQPAVVLPSATMPESAERTCLRCSTPMLPGELQQHLRIHLAGEDGHETPVLPRAWACPNCGYAELVVEPMVVPFASAVAATPDDLHEGIAETHAHGETTAAVVDHEGDYAVTEQPAAPFADDDSAVVAGNDEAAEAVVAHDAADAHIAQPVMAEEAALAPTLDDYEVAAQEPVADEPVSRDTLVLPAVDRDAEFEPPPSELVSEVSEMAADQPVSRDTVVLPALHRDEEVAHDVAPEVDSALDVASQSARETAVLPALDAGTSDMPTMSAEESTRIEDGGQAAHAQAMVEGSAELEEAAALVAEAPMRAPLEAQPEASGMVELPSAEADEVSDAAEQEEAAETHGHADEALATNRDMASDTFDLTPIEPGHVNGVLRDSSALDSCAADTSSVRATVNGQRPARTADASKQWYSRRSTTSAKISRIANKHSGNSGAANMPDVAVARSKSRSQRKK